MNDRSPSTAARYSHTPHSFVGGHLLKVSPVPTTRSEIIALAVHFAHRFATTAGKEVPDFSEDAARYLASRRWALADLTMRVCRAVEDNTGNLITAADLGEN